MYLIGVKSFKDIKQSGFFVFLPIFFRSCLKLNRLIHQQIRGNCSPNGIFTTLFPPNGFVINTFP